MTRILNCIEDWFTGKEQQTIQEFIQLRSIGRLPTDHSVTPDVGTSDGDNAELGTRQARSKRPCMFSYSLLRFIKVLSSAWNNRFPGWRGGIIGFTILTCAILILNLSILAWTATHMDDGYYATLAVDDWENISNMSGWLHTGINILSTALLAGSNYCMQCLTSPTREEIDAAHARSSYLNIGILSWRNVWAARKRRVCVLSLLTITSVLMHPIYDTSLITTAALYSHISAIISPEVVYGDEFTFADMLHHSYAVEKDAISKAFQDITYQDTIFRSEWSYIQRITASRKLLNTAIWENISVLECTKYQSLKFHTERSTLLLVKNGTVDQEYSSSRELFSFGVAQSSLDRSPNVQQTVLHQNVPYHGLLFCLRRKEAGQSRLKIHIWLFLVATSLISLKLSCFLYTLREQRGTIIVTTGDAIVSFLESPCVHSTGMCLLSQEELSRELEKSRDKLISNVEPTQRVFKISRLRYHHSVSFNHWVVYISLFALTILFSGYGFNEMMRYFRNNQTDNDLRSLWNMGFGKLNERSLTTLTLCDFMYSRFEALRRCETKFGDASAIALGNVPLLAVSGIYLCLNHQLTLMVQLRDWARLASQRQPLRVSNPESTSDQVSTYWLSLPHRYGVPLLSSSALLGWLVSQTLFIVHYRVYEEVPLEGKIPIDGSPKRSYMLGFSAIALIFSIGFGLIVFGVSVAIGFCKCASEMPLGPSNSLVIAAACHPPERDRYAARKMVKWGAIPNEGSVEEVNVPHHCTITSRRVEYPVEGRWYK